MNMEREPDILMFGNYEIKHNLMNSQILIKLLVFLDLFLTILYGVTFYPILTFLPFFIFGIYGVWKYRPNFVTIYHLSNIVKICFFVYCGSINTEIPLKIYYYSVVPVEFFMLHKFWLFNHRILSISQYERDVIRGSRFNGL